MNSARCTTGNACVTSPRFCPCVRISRSRLAAASSCPRSSTDRTGSMAPDTTTACHSCRSDSTSLARKLRTQPLADTGKPAFSHLAQNRILTGKIPEKGGLADFEHLHDVVDSGVLVSVLAKQLDRSIDNLLPQARLLPLPKPDLDLFSRCLCCPTPCRKRTWQGLFLLASITGTSPPATSVKCEINYNKIATNVKLSKREG